MQGWQNEFASAVRPLEFGGGRIDFALCFAVVGAIAFLTLQSPVLSFLVFIVAGLAGCSALIRSASVSWLNAARRTWWRLGQAHRVPVDLLAIHRRDSSASYRGFRLPIGVTAEGGPVIGTVVLRDDGNVVSQSSLYGRLDSNGAI